MSLPLTSEYTISNTSVEKKESSALNIFWLGFIVYSSAYTLFTVPPYHLYLNGIQFIGLLLMGASATAIIHFRIENNYLKSIYVLYCAWLGFTIVRGFKFDFGFLNEALFNAWFGILPYFVPIFLLFPKNVIYLKKVFSVIATLSLLYLVFCIVYRKDLMAGESEDMKNQMIMEYFSKTLSVPCGFLLLTYIYHSNKRKLLAFGVVIITLILALVRGRRAIIFMDISYLLVFYIIYLYVNKLKYSIVIISLLILSLVSFFGYKVYTEHKNSIFSIINERFDEDTRTGVEDCFYDDLKTKDWIIGKGMLGEYYCPGVDENGYTEYRSMIETDYLNIILKGGIISLLLLLLITIPAIIKGIFYSKNILSKAAGIWILLWVIDLYPASIHTFTLNYVLVWIAIGICYSASIRNIPENTLKEIFSN